MRKAIQQLMGKEKYIIAAVHLLPLPGSADYDRAGGMSKIIARAKHDSKILADEGVQSFLFTNEADMPYLFRLPQESVAAFSVAVQEVMSEINIPFGVNVLVDAYAAFCIAHATGASFIRGLFSGVYISDNGIIENQGPKIFRERANLGARLPYFFHNLSSPVGTQLVNRDGAEEAKSIMSHIAVDGFTLPAKKIEMFKKVREVAPKMPLVVGTGTNKNNLESLLDVCDGTIVATCLREDGELLNPVDPVRVKEFMKIFNYYK
jgi:hypothetical protein